jgi:hypothetical protein
MKHFLLLLLLCLFVSCKDDETTIIGFQKTVMDSIYKKNKPKVEALCNDILSIKEIKEDLNTALIISNDNEVKLIEDAIKRAEKIFDENEINTNKTIFKEDNIVLIDKYSNIVSHLFNPLNSDLSTKNYKFNIRLFNDERSYFSGLPRIWYCYQEKEYLKNLNESLTLTSKKELLEICNKFLNTISNAKYYALVNDKFYFSPQTVNKDIFESGLLITSVKIFDRKTKQKIAQKLFYIKNNDTIQTFNTSNKTDIDSLLIKENLFINKNKEITDFFIP